MKSLTGRWRFFSQRNPQRSREIARESRTPLSPSALSSRPPRALPRPALRWVGPSGKIALRAFDWNADAETICLWQRETYALNFPGFHFNDAFASAFRHDLRRATLDDHHGLFMLDEGPSGGKNCGFIWLVVCLNTWTNERYGYINNLYVVSDKRGQHLGSELLDFSDDWFKRRRVSKMRLTVTASNAAACHLYEKNGYEVTRWEMEKEIY